MDSSIAVLIPCHEDCEKAEKLQESLSSQTLLPEMVKVIHNGCKRTDAFDFANKARAINIVARLVPSDLILILDADVLLAPTFIEAVVLQVERDGLDAGSGLVWFISESEKFFPAFSDDWYNNGGALFVRRDVLVREPLCEDCVVEDTEYGLRLEKAEYKTGRIESAAAYTKSYDDDEKLVTSLRREVRYSMGSIQLALKGYRSNEALSGLFELAESIAIIGIFLFLMKVFWPVSLIVFAYIAVISLYLFTFYSHEWHLTVLIMSVIVPIVGIILLLRKKRTW